MCSLSSGLSKCLPAAGRSPARLFLIDAHALCYRSYFAIKGLQTSKGQATNAIYGFVNTLRKILRDYQPQYLAVCFDVGKKTYRQERFAKYKIQRPSMPADLISQIPLIKKVVEAYNLPVFEFEGFEADDVIATIVRQLASEALEVIIVSDDKDMYQLLNENVKVFSVRQDRMMGYEEAKEHLGIEPQRITDFIGLAGDAVDNIPGVHGIGEVTARSLVNEYGSLENILKNMENLKSAKVREKLLGQKDMAMFSKELSTLDTRVPISFRLNDMEVKSPQSVRLLELFWELEFRKLAEEFAKDTDASPAPKVQFLEGAEEAKALLRKIRAQGQCAILNDPAPEETGTLFSKIALYDGKNVYQIREEELATLKELFEDREILKITHNAKELMKLLFSRGLFLKGKIFDVMLAAYLLSPGRSSFDLETICWEHLKANVSSTDPLTHGVPLVYQMYPLLLKELKEKKLLDLFTDIEMPLAYVLFRMETTGVKLDEALLTELSRETEKKIKALERELYQAAGMTFNLNSPKQLSHVLFEKLKLPVVKKTKTGFSTDEGVLTKLALQHNFPAQLLEYRQLAKLKSTYIDALPKLMNPQTNRLHAYFNQTGTETGRLSSNNPNLQNIPIRTELGREIRKAFVPSSKNHFILSADYSQIELRILAHLSGDEQLKQAFLENQDIHRFTAALIFNVDEKDVSPTMRDVAKRVNFGIIYGMSAFGLAKDLEIPQDEAQDFIDRYFLRYPKVKKFMDSEIQKCREKGFVVTLLNRRRYIPEITSDNPAVRQFAERHAINTPVQGSAADLLKLAMINIQKGLEKNKFQSTMIITVHDELVFDVLREEEEGVVKLIRQDMEHPLTLSVPTKVSIKVGKNWCDMKEVE